MSTESVQPRMSNGLPVPQSLTISKKTFLDDITSFVSKNKYSIAVISLLAGICVYYYIKSKEKKSSPEVQQPQVLNEDFGFPDDPAVNQELPAPDYYHEPSLSVSSMDTVEIGENESKILAMDDANEDDNNDIREEGVVETIDLDQEEVEEKSEVYRSGPRKGQKKEKGSRRRRKASTKSLTS